MWTDGLWLMGVGMTTVFAFLTLLVAWMHLQARIFASWPEDAEQIPYPATHGSDDAAIAAAIAVAWAHQRGRA